MAGVGWRTKTYEGDAVNVIPTTKAAAATTIAGTELYPFEAGGWGGANVAIEVGDTSKITDTMLVKSYVSFDEGTTWLLVNSNTTILAASSGFGRIYIPFAPRLRVDVVYDGSAELGADHGIEINVEFQENDPEAARTLHKNVVWVGDTAGDSLKAYGDSTLSYFAAGDTMTFNSPNKVHVCAIATDLSKIANTLTYKLQSSMDASHWWSQSTLGTAIPANGSGPTILAEEETSALSKYGRIYVTGDTASTLEAGHGIKFYVLSQE